MISALLEARALVDKAARGRHCGGWTKEIRMTNDERQNQHFSQRALGFVIRISFVIRDSSFVIHRASW
jgi:hypothetical protein